jgi:hypothetical protein
MSDENDLLLTPIKCRICLEPINNIQTFCNCKGDMLFHKECFEIWLSKNTTITHCEICQHKLNIKTIYNKLHVFSFIFILLIIISICIFFEIIVFKINKYDNKIIIFTNAFGLFLIIRIAIYLFYCIIYKKKKILMAIE